MSRVGGSKREKKLTIARLWLEIKSSICKCHTYRYIYLCTYTHTRDTHTHTLPLIRNRIISSL